MVSFVLHVLGKTVVLFVRLGCVLPLAYVRKRAAERHFVAELTAMGLPDDVIRMMTENYREMLNLNPFAYLKIGEERTVSSRAHGDDSQSLPVWSSH